MKTALCIPVADSFSRVLGVGGAGAGSGVGSLRLQPDRPTSMAAAIELTAMQDLKRELGFCLMSARFGEKVPSPKPGSHMAHAIAMPVLAGSVFLISAAPELTSFRRLQLTTIVYCEHKSIGLR